MARLLETHFVKCWVPTTIVRTATTILITATITRGVTLRLTAAAVLHLVVVLPLRQARSPVLPEIDFNTAFLTTIKNFQAAGSCGPVAPGSCCPN